MALRKETVMTSMGPRPTRDSLCYQCGERKPGLFTINANGQAACSDCVGKVGEGVLKPQVCDPENCACGATEEEV